MAKINIAANFTDSPGARYRSDGPFSGEQFREEYLEKHFIPDSNVETIEIVLDGVEGYATSFLEESFGGLARKFGIQRCLQKLKFVSTEDALLIDEIKNYIEKCNEQA